MKDLCPCGSTASYAACCARYHEGQAAPTAQALMRSRYTAYVLRDEPYLLATWHASKRPPSLSLDDGTKWLGLSVKAHHVLSDREATVRFVARYRDAAGKGHRLEELSQFVLEEGRWYYVSAMLA